MLFTLLMIVARRIEMRRLAWGDFKFMDEQLGLLTRIRKDRIESCNLIPLAAELACRP